MHIGTVGTVVVSKSLSLLLLLVTLLTASAGLQSGASRLGSETRTAGTEIHSDITSLQVDVRTVYSRAVRAPALLRNLWSDMLLDWRDLAFDASAQTRSVQHQIESVVNPKPIS